MRATVRFLDGYQVSEANTQARTPRLAFSCFN